MSSDYYGFIAGEIADAGSRGKYLGADEALDDCPHPCCEHCDHDPGVIHPEPCENCQAAS